MYKQALLLLAVLSPMAAWADGKPDTLAIMKNGAFDFESVMKIQDLSTGGVIYQIEFCYDHDCDRFEGSDDKLAMLSDYAYLFAAYAGTYDRDFVYGMPDKPNPMVTDAKEKGYAQAVLDSYREQYHCPQGDGERKCVMHALFEAAGIRRYHVRFHDTDDSYYPVDEDGKPLSPPPS